ncbi:MAG: ATP-binding protein [Candidatus Izemoplasmatales bacterium]
MNKKYTINDTVFTVIAIILSTLFSIAFEGFGFRTENIILIYVATLIFIIVKTRRLIFGFISILVLVFVFNFFFTDPRYTFIIDDPNYIVTLVIFAIVGFFMGALTNRLQLEINKSLDNSKKLELLYSTSKSLLNARNKKEIISTSKKYLSSILNCEVIFYFDGIYKYKDLNELDYDKYQDYINYAISQNLVCGFKEPKYYDLDIKIFPIISTKDIKGALILKSLTKDISKQEKEFVQTSILNIVTAIDKEIILREEENTRIEIEKEKIKSSLLRSISHDLRTPLTSLKTGTSFLYDSFEKIDDETKKSMLLDINNETSRLNDFVDNLLNMTRLTANKFTINKKIEVLDEILLDVYRRVKTRLGNKKLNIEQRKELIKVNVDGQLLTQVFVNLIDNAIRHTKDNSVIQVNYQIDQKNIIFKVSDNGGGIPEENITSIFSNFTSIETRKEDNYRGIGLGLNICKAIVNAHGGKISVFNNEQGGATFEFNIPNKSK